MLKDVQFFYCGSRACVRVGTGKAWFALKVGLRQGGVVFLAIQSLHVCRGMGGKRECNVSTFRAIWEFQSSWLQLRMVRH